MVWSVKEVRGREDSLLNCEGGLLDKLQRALDLNADISVIQEAHDPIHYEHLLPKGSARFWHVAPGATKGIVVWIRPGWRLKPHEEFVTDSPFQQMIPLHIQTPELAPLSVWAV